MLMKIDYGYVNYIQVCMKCTVNVRARLQCSSCQLLAILATTHLCNVNRTPAVHDTDRTWASRPSTARAEFHETVRVAVHRHR